MFTSFSLVGLLTVVIGIAVAGPALWWMLLADKGNHDLPFYSQLGCLYQRLWVLKERFSGTCDS